MGTGTSVLAIGACKKACCSLFQEIYRPCPQYISSSFVWRFFVFAPVALYFLYNVCYWLWSLLAFWLNQKGLSSPLCLTVTRGTDMSLASLKATEKMPHISWTLFIWEKFYVSLIWSLNLTSALWCMSISQRPLQAAYWWVGPSSVNSAVLMQRSLNPSVNTECITDVLLTHDVKDVTMGVSVLWWSGLDCSHRAY